MYLIDTNIISELRKKKRANLGVQNFFQQAAERKFQLYVSVVTLGELRRGVELVRHRGDIPQAKQLDAWLQSIFENYAEYILNFTEVEAQVWGNLCVPQSQNAIDKQIAATALANNLTLVTRNVRDFKETDVPLLNPFEEEVDNT